MSYRKPDFPPKEQSYFDYEVSFQIVCIVKNDGRPPKHTQKACPRLWEA